MDEQVLATRASKVREILAKASEAKPVTVTEIAQRIGSEYRSVFQIVKKQKNLQRKQIAKLTSAGNETPVFGYWLSAKK